MRVVNGPGNVSEKSWRRREKRTSQRKPLKTVRQADQNPQ